VGLAHLGRRAPVGGRDRLERPPARRRAADCTRGSALGELRPLGAGGSR
jgi:hypothetical protein